jgi:hypothetical protein
VQYPLASPDDLAETAAQVEALGRRIVAREVAAAIAPTLMLLLR